MPVIDIRLQREWEETGIVAGSKLLTFFDAQGRHDAAGWLERVKPLAKPNEAVIVICRTGNRTKPVSQFLSQQAGYTTVYNVKHGIKRLDGAGGAVVARHPEHRDHARPARPAEPTPVARRRCASCQRWSGLRIWPWRRMSC